LRPRLKPMAAGAPAAIAAAFRTSRLVVRDALAYE
jgi:hypothetical protein